MSVLPRSPLLGDEICYYDPQGELLWRRLAMFASPLRDFFVIPLVQRESCR
jgi:hypothetical protein